MTTTSTSFVTLQREHIADIEATTGYTVLYGIINEALEAVFNNDQLLRRQIGNTSTQERLLRLVNRHFSVVKVRNNWKNTDAKWAGPVFSIVNASDREDILDLCLDALA
jgi:hypothetical protein